MTPFHSMEPHIQLFGSPLFRAQLQKHSGSDTQECPESQVSVKHSQSDVSGHHGTDTQECPKSQVSVRRSQTNVSGHHGTDTQECPKSQVSVRRSQTDVCGQRPVPAPRRSCMSKSDSTDSTSLSTLSPISSPLSSPVLRTPYQDISSRPPIPVPRTSSMLRTLEEPWKQPLMPTSKLKGTSQLLQNPTSNGNYTTLDLYYWRCVIHQICYIVHGPAWACMGLGTCPPELL